MKNLLLKLITIGMFIVLTLVIVVASSYAWMSMSTSPTMSGLQIKIGGSNTILIAPDITKTVEGNIIHYPGEFSASMNFSKQNNYAYLQNLVDLSPVSTADGINWYFPAYYSSSEENSANDGTLREISDFLLDDTMLYANLEELPADDSVNGCYAAIDFWVVSPANCNLRVSVGDGDGGSYLINLPQPIDDENGSYKLDMSNKLLASCARVGFLANTHTVKDLSINNYINSPKYNTHYRSLRGIYQEKGGEKNYHPAEFTIYEPNANYHHEDGAYTLSRDGKNYRLCENGSYVVTKSIGNVDGVAQLVDVSGRTTVQTSSDWSLINENDYHIEQIFQAYLAGVQSPELDILADGFYRRYLGYQCNTYLNKGSFIKNTENLIRAADGDGVVEPDIFNALNTHGATDDIVIVGLEKNIPQRIRMFVWIEGQDIDCAKVGSTGGLMLNLELAGSAE